MYPILKIDTVRLKIKVNIMILAVWNKYQKGTGQINTLTHIATRKYFLMRTSTLTDIVSQIYN